MMGMDIFNTSILLCFKNSAPDQELIGALGTQSRKRQSFLSQKDPEHRREAKRREMETPGPLEIRQRNLEKGEDRMGEGLGACLLGLVHPRDRNMDPCPFARPIPPGKSLAPNVQASPCPVPSPACFHYSLSPMS